MGDRYERGSKGLPRPPGLARLRMPAVLVERGLPLTIGHNGGPPLDEPVNDIFVGYRWRKAHREAWRNPSPSIMRFRLSRARAAGVSYRVYTAHLLDTGVHLQRDEAVRLGLADPSTEPSEEGD